MFDELAPHMHFSLCIPYLIREHCNLFKSNLRYKRDTYPNLWSIEMKCKGISRRDC
ncbi:Protein of unknown function [Pyronema omphalodes CBS 100304]|uniref:Uncharacterized protein n=1 Tax=Pyronema omphalodes (strain CBS 100304) TaxID=1076935 RepID=U4LBV9_PYROM|nr:Protein of unknown function [Pyronema omphalodes CBS 100304]